MRTALTIAAICLISAGVLAGRYLVFEYQHGDREVVSRLFDRLS